MENSAAAFSPSCCTSIAGCVFVNLNMQLPTMLSPGVPGGIASHYLLRGAGRVKFPDNVVTQEPFGESPGKFSRRLSPSCRMSISRRVSVNSNMRLPTMLSPWWNSFKLTTARLGRVKFPDNAVTQEVLGLITDAGH
ncbi:hypothetical protein CEXT_198391 [Caerostris extrusa]|uniref:Uncharacterized protein n=1 Tax=Caerostris extrusa TaxID=172846 RepID=A0AAV4R8C8_CAEEX|nr:hypothetical protein CEXT_198391 [Caerostris extrusa]